MFLVSLAIFLFLQHSSLAIRSAIIATFCIVLLMLMFILPEFWWATSDDFPYFIAVTEGIAKFGVQDSLAIAEHGITNWHWVTYGWVTSTDILSTSNTWLRTLVAAPMLMGASTTASLTILVKTIARLDVKRSLIVTIISIFSIGFFPPSLSFTIALSWLVAAVVIIHLMLTQQRGSLIIGVLILTVGVVGGKPSGLPLLIAVVVIVLIRSVIRRKQVRLAFSLNVSTVIAVGTYFSLFYSSGTASSNIWLAPFKFLTRSIDDINSPTRSVLTALLVIAILPLSIRNLRQLTRRETDSDFVEIASSLVILPVLILLDGWADSMEYVLYPCFLLSLTFVVARRSRTLESWLREASSSRKRLLVTSITGIALTLSWLDLTHSFSSESKILLLIVLLGSQALLEIRFRTQLHSADRAHRLALICLLLVLIPAVVPPKSSLLSSLTSQRLRSDVDRSLGSMEIQNVGEWLRVNTPATSIIVTNYFCSGDLSCAPADWWRSQIDYVRLNPDFFNEGCDFCNPTTLFGGADYSLAAFSARRFLILGPRFQSGLGLPPDIVRYRVQESIDSISTLSAGRHPSFEISGITHAVVYLPFVSSADEKLRLVNIADFFTGNFVVVTL